MIAPGARPAARSRAARLFPKRSTISLWRKATRKGGCCELPGCFVARLDAHSPGCQQPAAAEHRRTRVEAGGLRWLEGADDGGDREHRRAAPRARLARPAVA